MRLLDSDVFYSSFQRLHRDTTALLLRELLPPLPHSLCAATSTTGTTTDTTATTGTTSTTDTTTGTTGTTGTTATTGTSCTTAIDTGTTGTTCTTAIDNGTTGTTATTGADNATATGIATGNAFATGTSDGTGTGYGRKYRYLDLYCGNGVRSLRYIMEVRGVCGMCGGVCDRVCEVVGVRGRGEVQHEVQCQEQVDENTVSEAQQKVRVRSEVQQGIHCVHEGIQHKEVNVSRKVQREVIDLSGIDVVGIDSDKVCVRTANETARLNSVHSIAHYLQQKITPSGNFKDEIKENLGMFDVVDVDPFGSAIPFIGQCLQVMNDGGLLLLTCTDSQDLFVGKSKKNKHANFQTSGIDRPQSSIACHEFGLRAAITAACMAVCAAGWRPTVEVCWAFRHGCRLILRVKKCEPFVKIPMIPANDIQNSCLQGLPLSYVHVNSSGTKALVSSIRCHGNKDTGERNLFESCKPDKHSSPGTKNSESWCKTGPLWNAATAKCTLLRAVLTKHSKGAEPAASILLERLLLENNIFENSQSPHVHEVEDGQHLHYAWGVYSTSSHRNASHNLTVRFEDIGLCTIASQGQQTSAPIHEDHKFFKVIEYC